MPASIRDALKRRGLRGKDLGRVEAAAGRALLDALVGVWHAYAAALGEWKSANGFSEQSLGHAQGPVRGGNVGGTWRPSRH